MPAGYAVRPAAPADLDGLVRLENEAFESDRLDRRALRHALRSPTILALVASRPDGAVAGYALVQVRRGSAIGRLTSLAVGPGEAGRGVGRTLLSEAEAIASRHGCDRLRLEVRADNARARRLYAAAAYDALGAAADYYEDGTAAWRFEKRLG